MMRILLTHGGHGFEHEAFLRLVHGLEGIEVTLAELPGEADRLAPGLRQTVEAVLMYDMAGGFTPAQREGFRALLEEGIGLVALHHNLCAHRDWPAYRTILGGAYIHAPCEIGGTAYEPTAWSHDQELAVRVVDRQHPITRGIGDFTIHDETYSRFYVAPDVHVLLATDHPRNNPEIAWTHTVGRSRVVYLMPGHDHRAWQHPVYPILLSRAIHWATGR
ncbi:MAG: ThuA domain-containing protein [Lentisphaeria bacterium]|nr:ThuA domain-containing protein [Lentisphaeria bacterium]